MLPQLMQQLYGGSAGQTQHLLNRNGRCWFAIAWRMTKGRSSGWNRPCHATGRAPAVFCHGVRRVCMLQNYGLPGGRPRRLLPVGAPQSTILRLLPIASNRRPKRISRSTWMARKNILIFLGENGFVAVPCSARLRRCAAGRLPTIVCRYAGPEKSAPACPQAVPTMSAA